MKTIEEYKKEWQKEENTDFQGWDFSHLKNRWKTEELSWDYKTIVHQNLSSQKILLDMGTGGGEFLLSLQHPYQNTSVTEAWQPNIDLCQQKLVPLGITVCPVVNHQEINLPSDYFDVIINRHAAYDVKEVKRMLKKDGVFITQQVGSRNCETLAQRVREGKYGRVPFSLQTEKERLLKEGFSMIKQEEEFPKLTFLDVGAFVYFAKIIEWTFPDFTVENNLEQLWELQEECAQKGCIQTEQHRFLLVAQKG